jgi:hypothetical protein
MDTDLDIVDCRVSIYDWVWGRCGSARNIDQRAVSALKPPAV